MVCVLLGLSASVTGFCFLHLRMLLRPSRFRFTSILLCRWVGRMSVPISLGGGPRGWCLRPGCSCVPPRCPCVRPEMLVCAAEMHVFAAEVLGCSAEVPAWLAEVALCAAEVAGWWAEITVYQAEMVVRAPGRVHTWAELISVSWWQYRTHTPSTMFSPPQ